MTAPTGPAPIRVLVVDDQELVRSGFCVILDAADGITVVGEAADGEAAVSQAAAHGPRRCARAPAGSCSRTRPGTTSSPPCAPPPRATPCSPRR
jgi:CheY-like chemotaxis protein